MAGKTEGDTEKMGWVEAAVKDIQVALRDSDITQNIHEDELTLIFGKFSVFQEGVLQIIPTVMERVDKMRSSNQTGFTDKGSSQMEALVDQILELEKDKIADRMRFDGL